MMLSCWLAADSYYVTTTSCSLVSVTLVSGQVYCIIRRNSFPRILTRDSFVKDPTFGLRWYPRTLWQHSGSNLMKVSVCSSRLHGHTLLFLSRRRRSPDNPVMLSHEHRFARDCFLDWRGQEGSLLSLVIEKSSNNISRLCGKATLRTDNSA